MSRPPVRDEEALLRAYGRRIQLLERRLATSGGGGGGGGGGSNVSAGMMFAFAGGSVPAGFLLCTGQVYDPMTFPALYAAIANTYGGTSSAPLLPPPGRVLVGRDPAQTEFDVLGETGGAKTVALTSAQLAAHQHPLSYNGGNVAYSEAGGATRYTVGFGATRPGNGDVTSGWQSDKSAAGSGDPHNNLQPYLVVNYIIATGSGTFPESGTPTVGPSAVRDGVYPPPLSVAEQVNLANKRVPWFNTDYGWTETYYAPSGSSGLTVPGLVVNAAIPAGWYPTGEGPRGVLYRSGLQQMTGGANFSAWNQWGAGAAPLTSWKNTPGNLNDGSAMLHHADSNAALQVFLAGRYRIQIAISYVNGTGTAIGSLRASVGAVDQQRAQPILLMSNYGQVMNLEHADMLMYRGSFAYFKNDQGSLGLGNAPEDHMSVTYLGPPLANRA